MAKGDYVEAYLKGSSVKARVTASRNGRRVDVKYGSSRSTWIDVHEVNRNGRPVGSSMRIRAEELQALNIVKWEA